MNKLLFTLTIVLLSQTITAQGVGINSTGAAPDNSAILDLSSTDKGFLITRVDTANINSPAFGLMTLPPIDSCLYLYNDMNWIGMGGGGTDCICGGGPPNNGGSPFDCGSSFSDSRDGKSYETVQIGNQCWMSENLNYDTTGSFCYNNDINNCNTYGRL
jgi:hypothetical protein